MFTCYSAQGNQANGAPGGFVLDDRLGGKVLLSVSHSGEHLNETRIDLDDGFVVLHHLPCPVYNFLAAFNLLNNGFLNIQGGEGDLYAF